MPLIDLPRWWGFGEFSIAQVNGLNGFTQPEIGATCGESGKNGGVGKKRFAGGKANEVRAVRFQFGGFGDADDFERGSFGLGVVGEVPRGVVIFVALGIADEIGFTA